MVLPIYRILLWLASPAVLLITALHGIRHHSLRYFLQRFGWRIPKLSGRPIWIHCASVGELRIAFALVRAWHQKHPRQHILLTTTTATSGRLYEEKRPRNTSHCYLPIDYPLLGKRFLDCIRPHCALIVETEIWLNLYHGCHVRGIPLIIVNARLSKTLQYRHLIAKYLQHSLREVTAILARSEPDRIAYASLCAEEQTVEVVGNLKYAPMVSTDNLSNLIKRPYCLAGSTHDNEEILAAHAWRNASTNDLLLVIAPRHIERSAKIARRLRDDGFTVTLHSQADGHTDNADIYLYDRIGQLDALIKHARLLFLGGSLVKKGGHNLMEAAQLSTPQVVGPYLDNVRAEAKDLTKKNALLTVKSVGELSQIFATVAADETAYAELAQNALTHVQQQADIAKRYVNRIASLCQQQ